jgi:predicted transcriptional regulator
MKEKYYIMPSAKDIKSARAYLGLSQTDLGELAGGLSAHAIANIENEKFRPTKDHLNKIHKVFWDKGIEFIAGGGFRKKNQLVKILEGSAGFKAFFDDVYEVAKTQGGEFLISNVNEEKFIKAQQEAGIKKLHRERMEELGTVVCKVIISEADRNIYPASYAKYKKIPQENFSENIPFYIYGDKVAIIFWNAGPKILIIHDKDAALAFAKQFYLSWNSTKQPPIKL